VVTAVDERSRTRGQGHVLVVRLVRVDVVVATARATAGSARRNAARHVTKDWGEDRREGVKTGERRVDAKGMKTGERSANEKGVKTGEKGQECEGEDRRRVDVEREERETVDGAVDVTVLLYSPASRRAGCVCV